MYRHGTAGCVCHNVGHTRLSMIQSILDSDPRPIFCDTVWYNSWMQAKCDIIEWNFKKDSFLKLNVAYNDVMRLLLRIPRFRSAIHMFANMIQIISTCQAVITNLIFKFIYVDHKCLKWMNERGGERCCQWCQVHLSNVASLAEIAICAFCKLII